MKRMVSEPIGPEAGSFDPSVMVTGGPGLPGAFVWRGVRYRVDGCEAVWKGLGPEAGGGEIYLRRHYFRLRMEGDRRWVVYCLRQPSSAGGGRQRWFLYTVEEQADRPAAAE